MALIRGIRTNLVDANEFAASAHTPVFRAFKFFWNYYYLLKSSQVWNFDVSHKKSMILTAEKTCRLISGLTIAAFFLGLVLGYNKISIFSSETVQENPPSTITASGFENFLRFTIPLSKTFVKLTKNINLKSLVFIFSSSFYHKYEKPL